MATKLIVSGLSEDMRDEDLYDLFDVYGTIVDVGLSALGIGFVVYDDPVCALRARLGMDGAEVNGGRLAVWPWLPSVDDGEVLGTELPCSSPEDRLLGRP
jgi:RNA recognition motif-containing protein